ncbi:MAG: glutamyl-tRNA reductase [Chitinophagaceae bacterium]
MKNILDYLQTRHITLINRTDAVAQAFAAENQIHYVPHAELISSIRSSDIILVATNAQHPTLLKSYLEGTSPKIIIDLSVPHNVEKEVSQLSHVRVVNIDDLSKVQDKTLEKRKAEIPKAQAIIEENMKDFIYWHQMRKHALVLQAVKNKLQEIHTKEWTNQKSGPNFRKEDCEDVSARIIQKVVNMMASKMRQKNEKSDQYMEIINELFETRIPK